MAKLKVVFMGTPDFALPALESLIKADDFEMVAVVTQEDKKVGRKQELTPPLVKKLALNHHLPVLQPKKIKGNGEFLKLVKDLAPDFVVVVAYGQVLPPEFLAIPRYGCVNLHPSLLPKYRGATPIEEALLHGDTETGITIMKMGEKLDSGTIYFVKKFPIEPVDNALTLRLKLSLLGGQILVETLCQIVEDGLKPVAQAESQATYCHKITKEDGLIDLWKLSAEEILNRIRAYTPWPSCFLVIEGKRLKILEATMDSNNKTEAGKVVDLDKNSIGLGTKKGLLIPQKVQLEGKAPLAIASFLLGNRALFKKLEASPK